MPSFYQIKTSQSFFDQPEILPNYLSAEIDRSVLSQGIRMASIIADTSPLKEFITSDHDTPVSEGVGDNELIEWAKETAVTAYHPCGTCKMGDDKYSVVDQNLFVYGIYFFHHHNQWMFFSRTTRFDKSG